jgi:hypothetical protein
MPLMMKGMYHTEMGGMDIGIMNTYIVWLCRRVSYLSLIAQP